MGPPIPHTYFFMEPVMDWQPCFAWWPTKTWDGRWTWLRPLWGRLLVTKPYLRGPWSSRWEYCLGDQRQDGKP